MFLVWKACAVRIFWCKSFWCKTFLVKKLFGVQANAELSQSGKVAHGHAGWPSNQHAKTQERDDTDRATVSTNQANSILWLISSFALKLPPLAPLALYWYITLSYDSNHFTKNLLNDETSWEASVKAFALTIGEFRNYAGRPLSFPWNLIPTNHSDRPVAILVLHDSPT